METAASLNVNDALSPLAEIRRAALQQGANLILTVVSASALNAAMTTAIAIYTVENAAVVARSATMFPVEASMHELARVTTDQVEVMWGAAGACALFSHVFVIVITTGVEVRLLVGGVILASTVKEISPAVFPTENPYPHPHASNKASNWCHGARHLAATICHCDPLPSPESTGHESPITPDCAHNPSTSAFGRWCYLQGCCV